MTDAAVTYDVTDWVLSDYFWARTLLERLQSTPIERAQALSELVAELARQQRAEEAVVLPSADGLLFSFGEHRRRYSEGREKVRELLANLEEISVHSEEFSLQVNQLEQTLSNHAQYIEREIVIPLKHCLSIDERLELGSRYAEARVSAGNPLSGPVATRSSRAGVRGFEGPLTVHLSRA